jgi:hypothetical protein
MKFDGTNWINVGEAGFSEGFPDYASLAFSPAGQPYLAFEDEANDAKATVMKFDGTNWVNVGEAGFSTGEAEWTSLAFAPNGNPYVAFGDSLNGATVMKFDSVMTGIDEPKEFGLSVYPNPADEHIIIGTLALPASSQLSIMNLYGQQLITCQITHIKTQIDITNLPGGIYFIRLKGEKSIKMGKFIKR